MNLNYLKIAWRILMKHKAHTLVNIVGLGVGFSVSVLLMIFVFHQLSFDNFQKQSDRIFRFTINAAMGGGKTIDGAMTHGEVARVLQEQLPGLELACRVYPREVTVLRGEQRFTGEEVHWVDSTFFEMFDFPLVAGNPLLALQEPGSVVMSRSVAGKYFPQEDPLGKVVRIWGEDYQVTAVVEDPPVNSHLQFGVLASFHTLKAIVMNSGISFPTYVMMKEGAGAEAFVSKASALADGYVNELMGPYGVEVSHALQPMERIYFHSGFHYDYARTGEMRNVYIFGFLAVGVILVAVFNFVNLITAQSEKRAREIGMRKVMGARRPDLFLQFLGEAVLTALLAFMFSLLLNQLLIHPFSQLVDEPLRAEYWYHPWLFAGILAFVVATGVFAGFYPSVVLSRFEPVRVLKGVFKGQGRPQVLRKTLVIFQFFISVFLVASVLLLHRQVAYMKHKDLGFERENVITVESLTPALYRGYSSLKAELLQHPAILQVSASQGYPGEVPSLQSGYKKGEDPGAAVMIYENRVHDDYVKTFGMEIVAGRDFDPQLKTDTAAIIINESAVRKLGLEDPVGQEIWVWQHLGKVIGVVRDYHFMSLHNDIDPIALTRYSNDFGRINIRIAPGEVPATLALLEEKFREVDPNYTLNYKFIDEVFAGMYRKEERVNQLITAAALLAIIISFMGLYALTSFTITTRIREIGIRKTLGASVTSIVGMLVRDLSGWILMGNLIAWPLAFYVVSRWKQNFAFQIDLLDHWYLFVVAGLLAAAVGVMATLVQAVSAAHANPVRSLKAE